jgi:hypothetical protein
VNGPRVRRLALIAVWIPVVLYALLVSRQFFHTANSAIYLSADDGVANISYALATEGRYGFLSSPVLAGMARHDGLFSYGPYYFYLGAAFIWMFGYSLVVLRSIHLVAMLGVAAAGGLWFRRVNAGSLGALFAVGVLMAFERGQWPMVRPDSLVSVFGVGFVIAAGAAIRSGQARYWFLAGLAASCGAFTHLVAWALVPAAALTLVVGYIADARDHEGRWRRPALLGPLVAVAAGGVLGTLGFYASFGFRITDQMAFLTDYQQYTGSMSGLSDPGGSFEALIARHFDQAYWYLPYPMAYAVWATAVAAPAMVVLLAVAAPASQRRPALAVMGPPTVLWLVYFASLGVYNNFHAGYAVLNQILWLWNSAALVAVTVGLAGRWPVWQRIARAGLWLATLVVGVGMLTFFAQRTDYRALAAATMTPIDQYVDHVLDVLPARARAWGTVELGIEHPGRVQLVQFWDGIKVLEVLEPDRRPRLSPDYLVWGHVENGINTGAVLSASGTARLSADDKARLVGPFRLAEAFPAARYTLMSLTAGSPYGVTRVYAWTNGAPNLDRPWVNVYDAVNRRWNRGLGPPQKLATVKAPSATVTIGSAPERMAVQTLQGELAPGTYLLRIALAPGLPADQAAIFVASATPALRVNIMEPTAGTDVSPWFAGEASAYLVYEHPGGLVYVSQFGTSTEAMTSVEASPVVALPNYAGVRRETPPEHAIPARQWSASFPEIAVTPGAAASQVVVTGNSTLYGYQAYGPRIAVTPWQRMRLRVPITVTAGRGCLGVLDETELRWLLAPDRLLPEYEFLVNDSHTVKPVLADCSGSPSAVTPLRATISDGAYALWSERDELYVDQLMREFKNAKPR